MRLKSHLYLFIELTVPSLGMVYNMQTGGYENEKIYFLY